MLMMRTVETTGRRRKELWVPVYPTCTARGRRGGGYSFQMADGCRLSRFNRVTPLTVWMAAVVTVLPLNERSHFNCRDVGGHRVSATILTEYTQLLQLLPLDVADRDLLLRRPPHEEHK